MILYGVLHVHSSRRPQAGFRAHHFRGRSAADHGAVADRQKHKSYYTKGLLTLYRCVQALSFHRIDLISLTLSNARSSIKRLQRSTLIHRNQPLGHLRLAMCPGVPAIRHQLINHQVINPQISWEFGR